MNFSCRNRIFHFKKISVFRECAFRYDLKFNECGICKNDISSYRQFSQYRAPKALYNFHHICKKRILCTKKLLLNCERFYSSSDLHFTLEDYDAVGFDLDNTICEFNVDSCARMEYGSLAKFLVEKKGYDEKILFKPLLQSDIDFVQRGLIVDTYRGNLLRIRGDGFIFKASHGTKLLNEKEIEKVYGNDRKWDVTTEFAKNPIITWNGHLSEKMRTFSDYFDMPAALALSRAIDSVEGNESNNSIDYYKIWKDVLKGLIDMYHRHNFALNVGGYFPAIKTNPDFYYCKCRPNVIQWLKELKKHKLVFLVTGSNIDFASHTASYCLGENWKDFFDIIVCYSRKPTFFLGGKPFVRLDGFTEIDTVSNEGIEVGGVYNQGNWQGLYQLFIKATGKSKPKCLYIGDNLIQDIFTVSEYTCCDTVAIAEELAAEYLDHHPSKDAIRSTVWGSYFSDNDNNAPSVWGSIIENYSKICIPNLDVLASKPFDYKFSTFKTDISGYHSLASPLRLNNKTDTHKIRL